MGFPEYSAEFAATGRLAKSGRDRSARAVVFVEDSRVGRAVLVFPLFVSCCPLRPFVAPGLRFLKIFSLVDFDADRWVFRLVRR